MVNERYAIIYSSKTGNTKELAEVMAETLPKDLCAYLGTSESCIDLPELLYIGFWTDKGTADADTLELLKKLENKKIFLFGTAGFGGSEEYFQNIVNKVKDSIPKSNTVIGSYMCQGKMPMSVRERYVKMKEQPNAMPNLDGLIENFDKALSHPNEKDFEMLRNMIK